MIDGGQWIGVNVECAFNGANGQITLPPHFSSVIGVTIKNIPVPVYGEFHQYVEFGPGVIDPTYPTRGYLTQYPTGYPTVVELTAGQQVRYRNVVPADAGALCRIFGDDTNNNPIFDVTTGFEGIGFAMASPETISTPLNKYTGFQKPVTKGRINVYGWDGATETLLSQYQPYETRPSYTRYLVGTVDANWNIGCLCRLRHMPVYTDTDFVRVGNLAAWEHALQAIKFNMIEQFDKATAKWDECFKVLNAEHMSRRGKARPELTVAGPLSNATRIRVN